MCVCADIKLLPFFMLKTCAVTHALFLDLWIQLGLWKNKNDNENTSDVLSEKEIFNPQKGLIQ